MTLAIAVGGPAPAGGQGAPSNLQILNGIVSEDLAAIMEATSVSLGVECTHCHIQGAYASDALPAKQKAREMMRMVVAMSEPGRGTFELLESPSCWTCHRGSTQPAVVAPVTVAGVADVAVVAAAAAPVPEVFSSSTEPAGEVYENVTTFADVPANELRGIMASFRTALGVGCDHCHVPGNWASDDRIEKVMARVMADMRWNLEATYFMGRTAVTCWTCHRGAITPQTSLPAALMP
jgi:hypothetical protein